MDSTTTKYIAPLTGVRAIAAGMVVLFHMIESARVYLGVDLPWTKPLFGSGQAGVTLFFTLSGFLITIRYFNSLGAKQISFGRYWLKRLVRIYPIYAFTLTFLMLIPRLIEGDPAYTPTTVIALYALSQGLTLSWFALGIPTGWTLTIEEIFYLMAPALMRFTGNASSSAQLPAVGAMLGRSAALVVICVALLGLTLAVPALVAWTGYNEEFIYGAGYFARLPEFIVGIAAALVLLKHRANPRLLRHANTLTIVAVVAYIALTLASNITFHEKNLPGYAALRFLSAIPSSTLLLGFSLGASNGVSRWLGSPVMDYLGRTSYALYLVHLTWPMQQIWNWLNQLPVHPELLVPLNYLCSVIASIVLYELIEQPVHRFLSKRLDRPDA